MLKIKTPEDTLAKIAGIRIKTDNNMLAKIGKGYQVINKDGKSALSLIFSSKCKHVYENTWYDPPTCISDECWEYTCIKCGHVKYEIGEPYNENYHEYEIVTDEETGLEMWQCTHCMDSFPVVEDAECAHEYEVTSGEGGVITYTCIHCGDEYSEGEVWCTCDNPTYGGISGPYTICGNCGGITGV